MQSRPRGEKIDSKFFSMLRLRGDSIVYEGSKEVVYACVDHVYACAEHIYAHAMHLYTRNVYTACFFSREWCQHAETADKYCLSALLQQYN